MIYCWLEWRTTPPPSTKSDTVLSVAHMGNCSNSLALSYPLKKALFMSPFPICRVWMSGWWLGSFKVSCDFPWNSMSLLKFFLIFYHYSCMHTLSFAVCYTPCLGWICSIQNNGYWRSIRDTCFIILACNLWKVSTAALAGTMVLVCQQAALMLRSVSR